MDGLGLSIPYRARCLDGVRTLVKRVLRVSKFSVQLKE